MEAVEAVAVVEVEEVVAETIRNPPTSQTSLPKVSQGGNVIKVPSTLTFRKGSGRGVPCISVGGVPLSSVRNPAPVHGRMFTLKSHQSEVPASSVIHK